MQECGPGQLCWGGAELGTQLAELTTRATNVLAWSTEVRTAAPPTAHIRVHTMHTSLHTLSDTRMHTHIRVHTTYMLPCTHRVCVPACPHFTLVRAHASSGVPCVRSHGITHRKPFSNSCPCSSPMHWPGPWVSIPHSLAWLWVCPVSTALLRPGQGDGASVSRLHCHRVGSSG